MVCTLIVRVAVQYIVDFGDQLDGNEWLMDKMPAMIQNQNFSSRKSGHEDHWHFRA